MLGKWWGRAIILLLSLYLFLFGISIVVNPKLNDGIGYVAVIIGFVLFQVYISAVKKSKIYKDELIREKARRGQPL